MRNFKTFIIGFITGAVIVSVPVVATQVYNIYENEYPIRVDGELVEIQGYNINDYSYFKLRDIGRFTNFNVDFKGDEIIIETTENKTSKENATTVRGDIVPTSKSVLDASQITERGYSGNQKYVSFDESGYKGGYSMYFECDSLDNSYHFLSFVKNTKDDGSYTIDVVHEKTGDTLLTDIEYFIIEGKPYISLEINQDVLEPLNTSSEIRNAK